MLDQRFGVQGDEPLLSDDDLDRLVEDFVAAAKLSQKIGFTFVDIKHCHGYLGHELLSGFDRPGKYGGDFENRTRFLRNVTAGIRAEAPGLAIGVRLSVFDFTPFEPGEENVGDPSAGSAVPPRLRRRRLGAGHRPRRTVAFRRPAERTRHRPALLDRR